MGQISGILFPQTVKACSVGDYEELRWIFSWGSKIVMFLAIPLFVGMMFFGTEFIKLWMPWSEAESRLSGNVLILLAIPQFFAIVTWPGSGVISGLDHIRFGAIMGLSQGVVNLALTLVFVMILGLGLVGVALGTLVPMIIFNVILVKFILQWIRFPVGEFMRNNVLRWCVAGIVFGFFCYGVSLLPGEDGWLGFGLKVIVLGIISVLLGWWIIFKRSEQRILRRRILGLFSHNIRL